MPEGFSIFKPTFTDPKTGEPRESAKWYLRGKTHKGARVRWPAFENEKQSSFAALRVSRLVDCRREGRPPDPDLLKWLDVAPPELVKHLRAADVIEASTAADKPLAVHLEGEQDPEGQWVEVGFRQAVAAKGTTAKHAADTVVRAADVVRGCGFSYFRDLLAPGAEAKVLVYLGGRRDKGEIRGKSVNYHVRDFKRFCRWLAKKLQSPVVPMADLSGVANTAADSDIRRALSPLEMELLIDAAAAAGDAFGLTGDERALLYWFGFETGIRPGQMRSLVVSDFRLDADPPTVHTVAKYVKRRRPHVQVLRPELAADLRERFASKLPTAPAFKMPRNDDMAQMLRRDLAAARAKWVGEAKSEKDREQRQRSDFLADVNHQGEKAVFYSTRHGHGSALADAGVPEKDIASSMHHASRATTARYLHSGQDSIRRAVERLPSVRRPKPDPGQKGAG